MEGGNDYREIIAVRGQTGVKCFQTPSCEQITDFIPDAETLQCKGRQIKFSLDGRYFAWIKQEHVVINNCEDGSVKQEVGEALMQSIEFSPQSSYIALWHPYVTLQQNPQGTPNMFIYNVKTGEFVKSFIQKKQQDWCPQWSGDEKLCARIVSNEVHIYCDGNFKAIAAKMHVQKIQAFSLSPMSPYHVAAYVPSAKSAPAFVRVHRYPNMEGSPVTSRSFYKSDKMKMMWNSSGTAVIAQAETDADKNNSSYYGESQIYLLTTSGEAAQVALAQKKKGPVYDFAWHPDSHMFCVVYGFVPPRAAFINLKGEEVFDFGEGYRNAVYFSPFGNLLAFSAFGNMQGGCEVWDVESKRLVSKMSMKDSTNMIWCPDGQHLISSTVTPRLRVANGYRYWHYSGALLHEDIGDVNTEVYGVIVRPAPMGFYKKPTISYRVVEGIEQVKPSSKVPYRPPQARSGVVQGGVYKPIGRQPVGLQPSGSNTSGGGKRGGGVDDILAKPQQQTPAAQETQKRIRNITKKLEQISSLKQREAAGEKLELNQVEKIRGESSLLEELNSLKI